MFANQTNKRSTLQVAITEARKLDRDTLDIHCLGRLSEQVIVDILNQLDLALVQPISVPMSRHTLAAFNLSDHLGHALTR